MSVMLCRHSSVPVHFHHFFFSLKRLSVLLAVLLLFPLSVSSEQKVFFEGETDPFPEGAELLTIRAARLYGGDCMLMTLGEHSMFIDLGTSSSLPLVQELIDDAGISRVEYFFNSHPHNDHIGGFISLVKSGFRVDSLLTFFPHNYFGYCVKQYEALQAAEEYHVPVIDLKPGDPIPFGDAKLSTFRLPDWPLRPNDLSAMLMVYYGDCSILFSADVEDRAQQWISKESGPLLKADILKYPHHGLTQAEPIFLQAVSPEFAFITNIPQKTVKAQQQLRYFGTSRMSFTNWGIITMQTDGRKWIVRQDFLPDRLNEATYYLRSHSWLEPPFKLP